MTNENPRELNFSLDFLEQGEWQVYIWEDGPEAAKDPISIQFRKELVTPESEIKVQLAPGGGQAIRIILA
jgi:alpha-glucosidase